MRTRPLAALVVTATAAALTSSALAAPSALTIDSAARTSASVVSAAGTAAFTGVDGPTAVGGSETPFPNADVAKAYGIDLVGASIEPLEDGSGLRFVWQLSSMPAVTPPEGVRYTWSFGIGDQTFQLQAKRTNVASTTTPEDPAGHAGALATGFFQLRGNCGATYLDTVPLANCPHLAFLEGAFDPAAATVHMDVPFGLEVAPQIAPGAVITEVQTATMSISASPQAGASTATAAEFINGWNPYYVPGGNVSVAVGTDKSNPATLTYRPATFADGSWTATIDRVASSATLLYARACEGGPASCTYASLPLG